MREDNGTAWHRASLVVRRDKNRARLAELCIVYDNTRMTTHGREGKIVRYHLAYAIIRRNDFMRNPSGRFFFYFWPAFLPRSEVSGARPTCTQAGFTTARVLTAAAALADLMTHTVQACSGHYKTRGYMLRTKKKPLLPNKTRLGQGIRWPPGMTGNNKTHLHLSVVQIFRLHDHAMTCSFGGSLRFVSCRTIGGIALPFSVTLSHKTFKHILTAPHSRKPLNSTGQHIDTQPHKRKVEGRGRGRERKRKGKEEEGKERGKERGKGKLEVKLFPSSFFPFLFLSFPFLFLSLPLPLP